MGNVHTVPAGLQDSRGLVSPAQTTTNTRVLAMSGPLATLTDVPTFPATSPGQSVTGTWIVGSTRVRVGGIPAITAMSTGIAYAAPPSPTGPMLIAIPDSRVAAM